MVKTPRVLVLIGYGINCDRETKLAFEMAGAQVQRVHINNLINSKYSLENFHILALPGGFSYGDDIASGKVLANKIKINLGDEVRKFISEGKLIIGICNGFQVMVKAGLLPDISDCVTQATTLTFNDSGRFEARWVHLRKWSEKCIWTRGIERIYLPVAHGEGKFFAEKETITNLEESQQIVFKYVNEEGEPAKGEFPHNPNGSERDIAAICDPSGRIFGMMPHPERFLYFINHPNWTKKKEELIRRGTGIPREGDGIALFRNGVQYVRDNL
ncbi:MAG: Phosphoribosylformylglycinamidine synthase subunit PurQ [Syntrophomonadaceae bacterium]|nr:Phosphoribosylformylglycinamidine synthase subunit PurQ [Bacillota bacterium]